MRARIIKVDGSTDSVDLPHDFGEQAKAAEMTLHCNAIEQTSLVKPAPGRPGIVLWADPDGLFSKPENNVAKLLVMGLTGEPPRQYIAGDVLVTGGLDSEGDILGLTEIQDSVLAEFIPDIAAGAMAGVR